MAKQKWGKIGAPKSQKRKAWLKSLRSRRKKTKSRRRKRKASRDW